MKIKKIYLVTGSRADYGLLYWLIKGLKKEKQFDLSIITTGMHFKSKFGNTHKEIIKDGFKITKKINILSSLNTAKGSLLSTSKGISEFSKYFDKNKPDLLIILGDRFEIFSAVISAYFLNIPIVHISGGELTYGALDDAIRHSITKMSWWHFVSTKEYMKRVIQLGEDPNRVFVVGGLGAESIKKTKLINKKSLEKIIKFKFGKKNLIVTYHPETLQPNNAKRQFSEVLKSLKGISNLKIIFTATNADAEGNIINKMIKEFVNKNPKNTKFIKSFGRISYLSTLKFVDGIVGNSSSGITEAPVFNIGTVNIGDRQNGRIKPKSVIDCKAEKQNIQRSIKKIYSKNFQKKLKNIDNIYYKGNTSDKIINKIKTFKLPNQLKKSFYDI